MDTIKYFNFNKFGVGRGSKIPDNKARLHYVTKENSDANNAYYCITLNKKISIEIAEKDFLYTRIGENSMTGELFLMFTNEKTDDALKVSIGRNRTSCISIYNKAFVEFLMKRFNIDKSKVTSIILSVSNNRSQKEDAIVILISK